MKASLVVPFSGLEVEVMIIPTQRGLAATIDYAVTVWQVQGNHRSVIVRGESMIPADIVQGAKTKLWESIKP